MSKTYKPDDFSPDAIEYRFSSGSWDDKDTRYTVARLRDLETIKQCWADLKSVLAQPKDWARKREDFHRAAKAMDEALHSTNLREPESLLRTPKDAPGGCYCKPGQCAAPIIMGRQAPCRDPEKAGKKS